jgi:hypothetical protein
MSLSPARRASSAAGAVPPARPAAAAVPAEAAASRRNSQPGFAASLPPSAVRPADVARPARSAAAFAMRVRGGELQVLLLRARWTRRGMQFIMRRCQEDPEDDDCEMSRLFIRGVSGAARDAVAHTTRAERQLIAAGVDELWARGDVPSAWLRDDEMSNRAFAERNLPLFARLAAAFDEDNPEARDPPTEWALPHRDVREGQSPAELAAHALQVDAGVAAGSRGPVFQLRVGPTAAVVLRKVRGIRGVGGSSLTLALTAGRRRR